VDEQKFYVAVGERTIGPVTAAQVIEAIRRGKIAGDADVCAVGDEAWTKIRDVTPFASEFAPSPAPVATAPRQPAPLPQAAVAAPPTAASPLASGGTVVEAAPGGFDFAPTTVLGGTAVPVASSPTRSTAAPIQVTRRMLAGAVLGVGVLCIISFFAGMWSSRPSAVAVPPPPATTASTGDAVALPPPTEATPTAVPSAPAEVATPVRSASDLIVGTWVGDRPGLGPDTYRADGSLQMSADPPATYTISGTADAATLITTTSLGVSTWPTTFPDDNTMICSGLVYRRVPAGSVPVLARPSSVDDLGAVSDLIVGDWLANGGVIAEAYHADGRYVGVTAGAVSVGRWSIRGTPAHATLTTTVSGRSPHPWPVVFIDRDHFLIGALRYTRTAE
jgi:hypothetical protein